MSNYHNRSFRGRNRKGSARLAAIERCDENSKNAATFFDGVFFHRKKVRKHMFSCHRLLYRVHAILMSPFGLTFLPTQTSFTTFSHLYTRDSISFCPFKVSFKEAHFNSDFGVTARLFAAFLNLSECIS